MLNSKGQKKLIYVLLFVWYSVFYFIAIEYFQVHAVICKSKFLQWFYGLRVTVKEDEITAKPGHFKWNLSTSACMLIITDAYQRVLYYTLIVNLTIGMIRFHCLHTFLNDCIDGEFYAYNFTPFLSILLWIGQKSKYFLCHRKKSFFWLQ